MNLFIHNHFFVKSLDLVKAGGIVAFVTSQGTLDKEADDVRKHLAENAELLGAIRLPNNTFKSIAGTEVTSDIIFLQKRENPIELTAGNTPDWVNLGITKDGVPVNKYFEINPDMVLGKMVKGNRLYGDSGTMCEPIPGKILKEQLAEVVPNIKGKISGIKTAEIKEDNVLPADLTIGYGNYGVIRGKLYIRNTVETMELVNKPKITLERAAAMVELRKTVHGLLELQINNIGNSLESEINQVRDKLNRKYDRFVGKYGRIADNANKKAFEGDNSYYLLKSLEVYDSKGKYERKADIFTMNTVKPKFLLERTDNAADALILSIAEKAKVDFEYMSKLTGADKQALIDELGDKIYQLPNNNNVEEWVTEDEYLTGNIRHKLAVAEAFGFERNINALHKAMPESVEAADIDPKLGAAWINSDYIKQFICETLDVSFIVADNLKVEYSKHTDKWSVNGYKSGYYNSNVTQIYGIPEMNAYEIIEATLNFKKIEVKKLLFDDKGKPVTDPRTGNQMKVTDPEKTTLAEQKQKDIKRRFSEWAFEDPDRREELVNIFNERFNSVRLREYDGSHLNFVGINPNIELKPHQRNAVARMLYSGNTLLAHEVGAGKTYEIIAAAMESKRLGLINKSMIAVPNHLTEQFAVDFRKLYPASNILVATEKDMKKDNRRDFMAKIAINDYDAVIIGHSSFDRLHLSPEIEAEYIKEELELLRLALDEAVSENGGKRGKSFTVKQIEQTIKNKEAMLTKAMAKIGNDNVIPFEKLGVDKLFIDESHGYKNLDIPTKMTRVAGLGSRGSGKALALLMKCKYLNEKHNFNACIFASGSPVSNSMTELYTIMRYLHSAPNTRLKISLYLQVRL